MSAAEKLACEWEARHDVQARSGRLGDPAALAHYMAQARRDAALGSHPHHHDGAAHPHPDRATDPSHPAWLRGWLRWGEDEDR
jgi:hypothetical protein